MNDQAIEQEIIAKGKTAPRVTLADLEANIADVEIVKHVSKTGQILRWAIVTCQNGYAAVGRPSVAASPENDDAGLGEKIAADNTKQEMWPLMGYALKQQLHEKSRAPWGCADCLQSFPDGIPATCPNKVSGCDELLAQGK